MPDPAFIWPADQAWCVANDIDPHCAGIGADVSAIDELLADALIVPRIARCRLSPPHIAGDLFARGIDLFLGDTWDVCLVFEAGEQVCKCLLLCRMPYRYSIEVNRH